MKDLMAKVKGKIQEFERKQGKAKAEDSHKQVEKPVSWDMSSDDALRAPIVSGYK